MIGSVFRASTFRGVTLAILCSKSLSFVSTATRQQKLVVFRQVVSYSCTMSTTSPLRPALSPTDITLLCSDGIELAGQSYGNKEDPSQKIMCLHGWMDNCRSYYHFAPHLLKKLAERTHLVAIDFPGHGKSSHYGDRPPMVLAETAFYVAEALRSLSWNENITLIGHSMGASVACLYAAAFPEQIQKLLLIEGVGPLARPAVDSAKHVRLHIEKRLEPIRPPRIYESLDLAVAARCRTARMWPGNQYLTDTSARELVTWGTHLQDQGVQFRHDPRLQWPSLQYFAPEQTEGVYKDIQCPTGLIMAKDGWPFDKEKRETTMELLQPVKVVELPGSHHLHMDPDTAQSVVEHAAEFLTS